MMAEWAQLALAVLIQGVFVAYLFGRLSAKLESLTKLVEKLCGDHTEIAVSKQKISVVEGQVAWGTRQFEALWRAVQALGRGDKVREYDPLDRTTP